MSADGSKRLERIEDKVDKLSGEIGGKGGLREELATVRARLWGLAALVAVSIPASIFNGEIARALPLP